MTDIAAAPFPPERGFSRLWRPIARLASRIEFALQVRRERMSLLGLDDGMLKDIGLDRGRAYAEATRPCWDTGPGRGRLSSGA
jgi:uncharacterized protein YjiS (DUF1127 family)